MIARGSRRSLNNTGTRKMLTPGEMPTPEECWYQKGADTRGFGENLQISHLINGGAVVDLSRSELQNTSFCAKRQRSLSAAALNQWRADVSSASYSPTCCTDCGSPRVFRSGRGWGGSRGLLLGCGPSTSTCGKVHKYECEYAYTSFRASAFQRCCYLVS
jgi:hypothetical protein